MFSKAQTGESAPPMSPARGAVSMPRDISHTPAITGVATSTVHTPFIQKCLVSRSADADAQKLQQQQQQQQPLEHMVVTFPDDGLQLTTTSLLGKGGFGRVYAARSNGGELYALKASSKKMSEGDWRRLKEEVALMSHFSRHPNVVRFIAAGRDEECAYVVMECCASRSLHDVIAQHGLELPEILWIGWALIDTIAFMHSKGCIHRDLKPQNLLFDFEGNLKITDFGLSSRMAEAQPRKTVAGTAMYMAPEIASAVYKRMTRADERHPLEYGKEVDTWSVGVVLYVMMTRMNPYLEAMEKDGMANMNKDQRTMVLFNAVAGAAWSWPPGWSGDKELCHVVDHILNRDPAKRATLQEVLDHPVWNRRPLSCPLSLMHKLNLLERTSPPRYSSARRSLSRVAENLAISPFRKTANDVLAEGMRRVVLTEQRARAQLALEHHETLHVMVEMLKLLRVEVNTRKSIAEDEAKRRVILQSQRLTRPRRRGGSEALVTAETENVTGFAFGRALRSQRQSSVALVEPPNTSPVDESQARIVRASPDKYAVVYPGRETATRWSLRPVVSLPRDLNSMIEEFKCMNKHTMTKLTTMPYGYNGFDCNVCDRGILKITVETPAFRCYKCDYDICMKCAYQGRFKDVNFICVSCTKKFTSSAKLRAHSLQCRGPSISPSPRRSSRMNTMLWDEPPQERRSLLEIQLPDMDVKPRRSGRSSVGRASSGGRITTGDAHVPSPEDLGAHVAQHRDATFPDMPNWSPSIKAVKRKRPPSSARSSGSGSGSGSGNLSLELPPQVRLSQQQRVEKRTQPRSSAELRDIIEVHSPPAKKGRVETPQRGADAEFTLNEAGEIIGIAAQRRAAREASLQQSPDLQKAQAQAHQSGVIVIRAETAAKPIEVVKQPRVPRSVSARRQDAIATATAAKTATAVKTVEAPHAQSVRSAPPVMSMQKHVQLIHTQQQQQQQQQQIQQLVQPKPRQPSASGLTAHGGPPLPRKGPGMLQNAPRPLAHAVPPPNFPMPRQPSHPLGDGALRSIASANVTATAMGGGSSSNNGNNGCVTGAFLALPREEQNRQRFVDDFLSGGWVRFYSFTNEDTVVMYYCLQPGRYGAIFPTEVGVGTAVVDIHSKLVLYVPNMNNESTNRSQPHPHVQTFYDEDVRLLSVSEAQRYLGGVLNSIMGFVSEIARLRAEGLTPAAVHAAYINHRNRTSVPTDTKFVYVRKVFPDPSGTFTLFRLSNLRSQVVCNTLMDIRWQSDRRHNVGQKYYVHADGTSEPFVVDHTGILAQVETVLSNNFRR